MLRNLLHLFLLKIYCIEETLTCDFLHFSHFKTHSTKKISNILRNPLWFCSLFPTQNPSYHVEELSVLFSTSPFSKSVAPSSFFNFKQEIVRTSYFSHLQRYFKNIICNFLCGNRKRRSSDCAFENWHPVGRYLRLHGSGGRYLITDVCVMWKSAL